MKITLKQIARELYLVNKSLSFLEKLLYSIFFSILCILVIRAAYITILKFVNIAIKFVIENYHTIIGITFSIILFSIGCFLYIYRRRKQENQLEDDTEERTNNVFNVYAGDNYSKNINGDFYGDFIEVHGNCVININQDFLEFAQEIREAINQLQTHGYSEEDSEAEIVNELAKEARKNPRVKQRLFKWQKSYCKNSKKTNDETQVAREVVKGATTYSYTSSKDFTEVVSGHYQKLESLLQAKKWEEADLETANIIYSISQKKLTGSSTDQKFARFKVNYTHITALPGKDFNTINKLWLKYSNNRFGFSIQKRIWDRLKRELKLENDYNYYFKYNGLIEKFGDSVGWRKDGNWLYYSDIKYSKIAPPGHLPMFLMLDSDVTERCSIKFLVLEAIVGRDI